MGRRFAWQFGYKLKAPSLSMFCIAPEAFIRNRVHVFQINILNKFFFPINFVNSMTP